MMPAQKVLQVVPWWLTLIFYTDYVALKCMIKFVESSSDPYVVTNNSRSINQYSEHHTAYQTSQFKQ
jgi:hypothetical protein